jgi:iron complex outermembrane receptor protein
MKNTSFFNRSQLAVAVSAVVTICPTQALVLEEVIVTAQKREQSLQDVGISVSAMSGDQMEALGLDNTQEITQQIPGLQVQSFTPGFTIFNLRGVSQNNFQDNLEAPVAVYFDDVYIGSMNAIGGQMFDMQRTEVLRGPQGTLFGRNATGGLIHFVTRKADDEELNGYVSAEVSEFNSYNIEAAAGGAITDHIRGRIAGRWEQSDGYFEAGPILSGALGEGSPAMGGNGSDANGADGLSLRANLQIDIGEASQLDLTASYSRDDDVPVGQYLVYLVDVDEDGLGLELDADNPLTGDVHKHAGGDESIGGNDTGLDREATSLTARFSTELSDGMEFLSITNWMDLDKSHFEDAGSGLINFPFATEAQYQQWSQELRLSGEEERLRWQVGAYYLNMDLSARAAVGGPLITGDPQGVIDSYTELESHNWSVFGQMEYDLSDQFTVIAGYRWSRDDKEIDFVNVATTGLGDTPAGTILFDLQQEAVGSYADVAEIDYGDYAARLQLNWQTNDDTLVFVSYNRGIKGGNWSPNSSVTIENFKHKEETLHAYELGIKTTLAEGRARLNATAFYYDYQDYQAFSLTNLTPQVTNSDASNQGGEVELFLTPTENLDVMLGLSFIDSEIEKAPGAAADSFVEDAELPQAPGYSFNYLFRYNWDALGGNMAAQLDGVYNDEQYLESHNGGSSLQEGYNTTNFSLSYRSADEAWDLRAWVKNINDEEWAIYSLDIGGFVQRQYAPPRWYGVTATYNW